MIAIIDYGAGNLRSVVNAFETIGQKTCVTKDAAELAKASALVLPGVGAFGDGVDTLRRMGLIEPLQKEVLEKKKPYLGICLGLQFLGRHSEEHGEYHGFGWVGGSVQRITPSNGYRIPHMGWNNIQIERPCPLFEGLGPEPLFYFVHSYHLVMDPGQEDTITSTCWHGTTLTASVCKDNIYGVQFHPEKSQGNGLKLLENFVELIG